MFAIIGIDLFIISVNDESQLTTRLKQEVSHTGTIKFHRRVDLSCMLILLLARFDTYYNSL